MWMCVLPAQTPVPSCFRMQGAGEKRLPNFPCRSTRLHVQMLITTGACMGQSARLEEQLVHLPLPPQVPVSTVTPPADNKDNHLRFPSWLIFSCASERPERRCLIFHTELLSAHKGQKLGGGQIAPPATHSPEGDRSVQSGCVIWRSNKCEIIYPLWWGIKKKPLRWLLLAAANFFRIFWKIQQQKTA